ncbi:hypothetical protein PO902_04575 [Planococcus maritimus]|uniref:hypothetical protein n=1 Tax=Planococcus sp. 11815 TaxID=2939413 RepID=UPI00237F0D50|nr:hypothetical protein [Planococcus sp. SK3692]MDE4084320.1 hypothetical protein [Planococcus maritimus]
MGNHNEMKKISAAFAASYERFIKGYQQYKAERTRQHPDGEVERYDNSTRVKQAQR